MQWPQELALGEGSVAAPLPTQRALKVEGAAMASSAGCHDPPPKGGHTHRIGHALKDLGMGAGAPTRASNRYTGNNSYGRSGQGF